jgi:hypothetical protein
MLAARVALRPAIARHRQQATPFAPSPGPSRHPVPVETSKPMQSLTDKTIALLRKASDFAAAAHDSNLTEVEVDGYRLNAITLELELRTLAGKLEFAARSRNSIHA